MEDKIRVTLVKSGIGKPKRVRQTLTGLGLTKMHKTMELNNTPAIRGMIEKVTSLVRVER
jgi:large subunit ribosomal protein L30